MNLSENKNYVFILGPHKSGSSLLRNLLDGHPDLFVIPIETHYFSLSHRFWVNYFLWAQRPTSNESNPQDFIDHINHYVNYSFKYRDIEHVDFINLDKFKEYLLEHWPATKQPKDEIINYFDAISYSIHSKPIDRELTIVEKSVSNAENAIRLQRLFPNAKFIHIMRNPYANLLSFRDYRFKVNNRFPSLRDLVECLKVNYYYLYKNQELINDYLVVKYEDIVTNTKEEMLKISQFLNIPFNENLLMPTANGKKWEGNSTQNRRFTGVSNERAAHFDNRLTKIEVEIINRLFSFIIKDYGYTPIEKKGSFLKPAKNERPRIYLYNRLYYYFS